MSASAERSLASVGGDWRSRSTAARSWAASIALAFACLTWSPFALPSRARTSALSSVNRPPLSLEPRPRPARASARYPSVARLATERQYPALGLNTRDPLEPPLLLRGHAARLILGRPRPGRHPAMNPTASALQRPGATAGAAGDPDAGLLADHRQLFDPGVTASTTRPPWRGLRPRPDPQAPLQGSNASSGRP